MSISDLQNASSNALERNFNRIKLFLQDKSWMRKRNRYLTKTIENIKNDLQGNGYKHKELNEYIAASVITHALDAWSYFGRAISALLLGDTFISKHLLYYSELRSAMSILAAQGVGVFDDTHFYIKTKDRCYPIRRKGRTHSFVWQAIDYWINNLDSVNDIFKIINPENIPLENWIDNFGIPPGMKNVIIKNWLKSIGFDLQIFEVDRNARNEVSYRPTTINKNFDLDYFKVLENIISCWKLCEPKTNYGLPKVDEILISNFFYIAFKQSGKRSIKQAPIKFGKRLKQTLESIGMPNERKEYWVNLICDVNRFENVRDIFDYIKIKNISDVNFIFGMLYRALFLLRISVAFCEYLIKSNSINKEDLEFWWAEIGYTYGLWNDHSSLEYFSDLWEDISFELDTLNDIINETSSADTSQYDIYNSSHISTAKLSSFERVHLWSIGL